MIIFKRFTFEAAHRLPKVPPDHKCARVHGHSYTLEVRLRGAVDKETGWVADFGDISAAVKRLIAELDHRYLNEVEGLHNPTAEALCLWLWPRLYRTFTHRLHEITVQETATSGATYTGSLG